MKTLTSKHKQIGCLKYETKQNGYCGGWGGGIFKNKRSGNRVAGFPNGTERRRSIENTSCEKTVEKMLCQGEGETGILDGRYKSGIIIKKNEEKTVNKPPPLPPPPPLFPQNPPRPPPPPPPRPFTASAPFYSNYVRCSFYSDSQPSNH